MRIYINIRRDHHTANYHHNHEHDDNMLMNHVDDGADDCEEGDGIYMWARTFPLSQIHFVSLKRNKQMTAVNFFPAGSSNCNRQHNCES